VCLLLGAQLVLSKKLLRTLIVKPENMLRNLENSGGVVLSESLMMAVARKTGRDKAHALVLRLAREARRRKKPFREHISQDRELAELLSPRRLAAALDYSKALGLAGDFVDEVVDAHRQEKRRRRRR